MNLRNIIFSFVSTILATVAVAQTNQYVCSSISGGHLDVIGGGIIEQPSGTADYYHGRFRNGPGNGNLSGTITATFEWHGPDPAPKYAIVSQISSVAVHGWGDSGYPFLYADDGLGDPQVGDYEDGDNGSVEGTFVSEGHKYTLVNGGQSIVAALSPSGYAEGDEPDTMLDIDYSVRILVPKLKVGGTIEDGGDTKVLKGQACSAQIVIDNISGDHGADIEKDNFQYVIDEKKFNNYVPSLSSAVLTVYPDDSVYWKNPAVTWYWADPIGQVAVDRVVKGACDLYLDVNANGSYDAGDVLIGRPDLDKDVLVCSPSYEYTSVQGGSQWTDTNGVIDGFKIYGPPETFAVKVDTIAPFKSLQGAGKWEYVQLVKCKVFRNNVVLCDTMTDYILDTQYPYADPFDADNVLHYTYDVPQLPANPNDPLQSFDWSSYFEMYVLYEPPVAANSASLFVPLAFLPWSVIGSAPPFPRVCPVKVKNDPLTDTNIHPVWSAYFH